MSLSEWFFWTITSKKVSKYFPQYQQLFFQDALLHWLKIFMNAKFYWEKIPNAFVNKKKLTPAKITDEIGDIF